MSIERVPREYAELRIDLSRDALLDLTNLINTLNDPSIADRLQIDHAVYLTEELENLRNVAQNLVDRFDAALTS